MASKFGQHRKRSRQDRLSVPSCACTSYQSLSLCGTVESRLANIQIREIWKVLLKEGNNGFPFFLHGGVYRNAYHGDYKSKSIISDSDQQTRTLTIRMRSPHSKLRSTVVRSPPSPGRIGVDGYQHVLMFPRPAFLEAAGDRPERSV